MPQRFCCFSPPWLCAALALSLQQAGWPAALPAAASHPPSAGSPQQKLSQRYFLWPWPWRVSVTLPRNQNSSAVSFQLLNLLGTHMVQIVAHCGVFAAPMKGNYGGKIMLKWTLWIIYIQGRTWLDGLCMSPQYQKDYVGEVAML